MVPFPSIPYRPSEWTTNFENNPYRPSEWSSNFENIPCRPSEWASNFENTLTDPLNGHLFRKTPLRRLGSRFFTKNDENHSGLSAPLHPRTACNKKQAAGKRVPQQPAFI